MRRKPVPGAGYALRRRSALALASACVAALGVAAQARAGAGAPTFGASSLVFEYGQSSPWSPQAPTARLSLTGRAPSLPADCGCQHLRQASGLQRSPLAGLSLDWPLRRAQPLVLSLGLALAHRSGYEQGHAATLVVHKQTTGGPLQVFAFAAAAGQTSISSTSLMATLHADARQLAPAFEGAGPWFSVGLGHAYTRVEAQTTSFNARLRLRGPGFEVDDRFTAGSLLLPAQSFNGLAWQMAVGWSWTLASDQILRVGLRYVDLGHYRIVGTAREWRVTSQGETLRAVYLPDRLRLRAREPFLSFVHSF